MRLLNVSNLLGGNAARRAFEQEVATTPLSRMAVTESNQTISELLERWRHEAEPEIRVALALTVAGAAAKRGDYDNSQIRSLSICH